MSLRGGDGGCGGAVEGGLVGGKGGATTKGRYCSGLGVQDSVATAVGYIDLAFALFTQGYFLVLLGLVLLALVQRCRYRQMTRWTWGET